MTAYVLAKGVLRASLEDEEVLLNPSSGMYHLINMTARSLLEAMEDGSSYDQAIEGIASRSGASVERVRADADAFVGRMVDRGLVEEVAT